MFLIALSEAFQAGFRLLDPPAWADASRWRQRGRLPRGSCFPAHHCLARPHSRRADGQKL